VPVLLNLSSWQPNREHFDAWLARRLLEQYPALASRERYGADPAPRLVSTDAVLPVLDGLDEMPAAHHAAAITALTEAVAGDRALVVACRPEEYQAAVTATGTTLGRAAVVELEPVDAATAAAYLPGGQLAGRHRWARVTAHLRADPGGLLARALSTPLMVYLARTAYTSPERDPAELCDPRRWLTPEQIEDHLLAAYLPAVYGNGPMPPRAGVQTPRRGRARAYSAAQASGWLAFIATQLAALGTRELSWWRLPHTIHRFEAVFGLAVRLTAGLAFGSAFGLTYGFANGPIRGLVYGISYGLAFELGISVLSKPQIAAGRRSTAGLVVGLMTGLTAALGVGVVYGFEAALMAGCEAGLIVGFGAWITARRHAPLDSQPRQVELGARRLCQATVKSIPAGLAFGLIMGSANAISWDLATALKIALALAVPLTLALGVSETIVMAADDQSSASPRSLLRGERAATIAQVAALGIGAGLADLFTTALTNGLAHGLAAGLAVSLTVGLVFGLTFGLATGLSSPWLRFVVAQAWFAVRGDLPWRLMDFLDDAHRRGILRQVGAAYQFRHARLQDHLQDTRCG